MSTIDPIIEYDNDVWRIISCGTREDGKVYCHLASTTQFRQQRNGDNPVQISDWLDEAVVDKALAAATEAEQSQARQCYVTGVGWCWMQDGEIIEVIATEEESYNDELSL
jgi:hypothetical protein